MFQGIYSNPNSGEGPMFERRQRCQNRALPEIFEMSFCMKPFACRDVVRETGVLLGVGAADGLCWKHLRTKSGHLTLELVDAVPNPSPEA